MITTQLADLLSDPGHDYISLKAELDQLQRDQAADPGEPTAGVPGDLERYELEVQARCRRAIEIISILRRTNTGPAKATGKRGASKKGKVDMTELRSKLLD